MLRKINKIIVVFLCLCLLFEQTGFAQSVGTELNLSGFFSGLTPQSAQDKFRPVHLRYLSYDALNNNFKLLLDKGNQQGLTPQGTVPEEKLKSETKKLFNYFLIGLTLPNEAFWVNLRPDSPQNIIDNNLEKTDIGKILLEADVQLKKDTANFTSPATPEGRKYWDSLYKKVEELFGYENITIPTLTRPWIVPDEIIIRESRDNAYIYKATLKVMLEQDYLKDSATYNFSDPRLKELNEYASKLIRELIIPKLTQEVNTAKRYAGLRQVYYSLILSQWFKQRFNKGLSPQGAVPYLIDTKNLFGLTSQTSWSKNTYFKQYQDSFNKGEYNIQEPRTTPFGQVIRSYMSGGVTFSEIPAAMQVGIINSRRNSSPVVNSNQGVSIGQDGSIVFSEEAGQLKQQGKISSPVGIVEAQKLRSYIDKEYKNITRIELSREQSPITVTDSLSPGNQKAASSPVSGLGKALAVTTLAFLPLVSLLGQQNSAEKQLPSKGYTYEADTKIQPTANKSKIKESEGILLSRLSSPKSIDKAFAFYEKILFRFSANDKTAQDRAAVIEALENVITSNISEASTDKAFGLYERILSGYSDNDRTAVIEALGNVIASNISEASTDKAFGLYEKILEVPWAYLSNDRTAVIKVLENVITSNISEASIDKAFGLYEKILEKTPEIGYDFFYNDRKAVLEVLENVITSNISEASIDKAFGLYEKTLNGDSFENKAEVIRALGRLIVSRTRSVLYKKILEEVSAENRAVTIEALRDVITSNISEASIDKVLGLYEKILNGDLLEDKVEVIRALGDVILNSPPEAVNKEITLYRKILLNIQPQMPEELFAAKAFTLELIKSPQYKERLIKLGYKNVEDVINKRYADVLNSEAFYTTTLPNLNHPTEGSHANYPYIVMIDKGQAEKVETPVGDVTAHEYGHKEINTGLSPQESQKILEHIIPGTAIDSYLQEPEQVKSDLNSLRYELYKQGVDVLNRPITIEDLDKVKDSKVFAIKRLFNYYKVEDILYLLNYISYTDPTSVDKSLPEELPQDLLAQAVNEPTSASSAVAGNSDTASSPVEGSRASAPINQKTYDKMLFTITPQTNLEYTMPTNRQEALKLLLKIVSGGKTVLEKVKQDLKLENILSQAKNILQIKADDRSVEGISKLKALIGKTGSEAEFIKVVGSLAKQNPYTVFHVNTDKIPAAKEEMKHYLGVENIDVPTTADEWSKNLLQHGGFGVVILGMPVSGNKYDTIDYTINRNSMHVDPVWNKSLHRSASEHSRVNQHNFLVRQEDPIIIVSKNKFYAANGFFELDKLNSVQKRFWEFFVKKRNIPTPEPGWNISKKQEELVERNITEYIAKENLVEGTFIMSVNPRARKRLVDLKEKTINGDYRAAYNYFGKIDDLEVRAFFNNISYYDKVINDINNGNEKALGLLILIRRLNYEHMQPDIVNRVRNFLATLDVSVFEKRMYNDEVAYCIEELAEYGFNTRAKEIFDNWRASEQYRDYIAALREGYKLIKDVTKAYTLSVGEYGLVEHIIFSDSEAEVEKRIQDGDELRTSYKKKQLIIEELLKLRKKYSYLRTEGDNVASVSASSPVTSEQKFIKLINSPQLGLINDPVFIRKGSERIKVEGVEAITIPPANYKKLLEAYGLKSSLSEEEFNRIIQAYPRVTIFDAQRMQELSKGDYNIMLARAERIIFHEKLHDGLLVSKTSSGQITDSLAREAMLYHFNKLPQVYREKLWNEFSDIATSKEWLADELVVHKLTFDKYPESTKNDNERDENEAELEIRLNKLFQESEMQQFWNAINKTMDMLVFAKASKVMGEITANVAKSSESASLPVPEASAPKLSIRERLFTGDLEKGLMSRLKEFSSGKQQLKDEEIPGIIDKGREIFDVWQGSKTPCAKFKQELIALKANAVANKERINSIVDELLEYMEYTIIRGPELEPSYEDFKKSRQTSSPVSLRNTRQLLKIAALTALLSFIDPVTTRDSFVPVVNINNNNAVDIEYATEIIQKEGWIVKILSRQEWEDNANLKSAVYHEGGAVTLPLTKTIYYGGRIPSAGHLGHETIHVLQSSQTSLDGQAVVIDTYDKLEKLLEGNEEAVNSFRRLYDIYVSVYNPYMTDPIKGSKELSPEEKQLALKFVAANETFALIFGNLADRAEEGKQSVNFASCNLDQEMINKIIEGIRNNPEAQEELKNYYIKIGLDAGRVNKLFSQSVNKTASSPITDKQGGIDFRAMPVTTQPVLGTGTVLKAGQEIRLENRPFLDQELLQIKNMINSGIIPSSERIKDYVQACCANRAADTDIDKVLSCIADILRLEEERVEATDPQLRELIVLLESGKPAEEMKLVLANISFAAKEPVLPGE